MIILGLLASAADRHSLRYILDDSNWKLEFADGIETIQPILRKNNTGVIVTDCVLPDGNNWKDLLSEIQAHPLPPSLILADRNADDRLWAEVLNLGAHDLLMKPFDANEVLRVIGSAWRSWAYQCEQGQCRRNSIATAMVLSKSAGV